MESTTETVNPLLAYIRQSNPILNLSSKGNHWPTGSIDYRENLEVFPLTGQDEILLLNTSSVLLGSVLAEIIESCVPAINDVWSMPRIDLDSVLIAIRCVSYNNRMNVQYVCPKCKTDQTHSVNLLEISQEIQVPDYSAPYVSDEIAIWFRSYTFREHFQQLVDQNSKATVLTQLADSAVSDEEKEKIINRSLREITRINIESLTNSIDSVMINNQEKIQDQSYIKEWLLKTNRETFAKVKQAIEHKLKEYKMPERTFVCKNTECNHSHNMEIDFNPADFLNKGD